MSKEDFINQGSDSSSRLEKKVKGEVVPALSGSDCECADLQKVPLSAQIERIRTLELQTRPDVGFKFFRTLPPVLLNTEQLPADPFRTRVFEDHEIISVEIGPQDYRHSASDGRLRYGITSDGRSVLQQRSWRGSAAAAVEMIRLDRKLEPDLLYLEYSNSDPLSKSILKLEESGLKVFSLQSSVNLNLLMGECRSFAVIEPILEHHTPVMVTVNPPLLGKHALLIDGLKQKSDTLVVRDPFHGWSAEIYRDALERILPDKIEVLFVKDDP
ncbi:MAG: hypothetical protein D6719_10345 [Candidatus Dadabacteria bacterium]|nr:MAG: hypothetical protein D6719_10345 [Candidatus Dadabacteria bacterium]